MEDLQTFEVELPLADAKLCEELARDLAVRIKPHWNKDDITFEVFTVGITNKIFAAQVADNDKLIFRVFGKNTEKVIDRPHELRSWAILAQRGLAAKLYAKFDNGLICGFLPGRSLSVEQVREPFIKKEICRAMADMHNISFDHAEPSMIGKIWEFYKNFVLPFTEELRQETFESHFKRPIQEEISEMSELVQRSGEDVGFTHNDLLIHNILYDKDTGLEKGYTEVIISTGKVSFIDYEYADANYALFDIANHFNEYAGVDNTDYSLCPKSEEKKTFIRDYLMFRHGQVDEVILNRMVKNTPLFEAASHLFWAVWALVQAQNSLIDFDYLGYAIIRHEQYKNRLAKFMQQ